MEEHDDQYDRPWLSSERYRAREREGESERER